MYKVLSEASIIGIITLILGKILLELFNKTNNSFNLITFFSGDENKENYQNIIKTKMLCEDNYITDLNDILRQFIYYDKYGY